MYTKIIVLNRAYGEFYNTEVILGGWVKTIRPGKTFGFIELNDGSCFKNAQIVYDDTLANFAAVSRLGVGAAITVKGEVIESKGAKQDYEIKALSIDTEGESPNDYVLQKKRHSFEFLRTIPHLRARTNTFSAVFRIRSAMSYAIHKFFNEKGFIYVHTPIITTSDCEGAGEMFAITTDSKSDFFGKKARLTVSGQLDAEAYALAFGNVYTFGPTFRAENSNTARHAAEFWMIEPEMAFADLNDDCAIAEEMLKYIVTYLLNHYGTEIEFFTEYVDDTLPARLDNMISCEFERITYTEAITILEKAKDNFTYPVAWGHNLQTEHERYLTERVFNKPVFVTDYPKGIKAFYMRRNDDGKTVAAMDLLVPRIGELIGGSQREERLNELEAAINEAGLSIDEYNWYLDLRRYGGVKHAGFGMGFERLIMYATGMANIRDCIPFPRTAGSII